MFSWFKKKRKKPSNIIVSDGDIILPDDADEYVGTVIIQFTEKVKLRSIVEPLYRQNFPKCGFQITTYPETLKE